MKNNEILRELRHQRGWSFRELARRTGIHGANLCRMERGTLAIGPKSGLRLAKAFRVGLARFYVLDDADVPPARKTRVA